MPYIDSKIISKASHVYETLMYECVYLWHASSYIQLNKKQGGIHIYKRPVHNIGM